MGAWDVGSFSNDAALDFVNSLENADHIAAMVRKTYAPQMDADDASELIAACDLLAGMMGRPALDMPEDALSKLGNQMIADEKLAADARHAVQQIRSNSELAELWAEDDDSEWNAAIDDLLKRLDPSVEYTPPPVPDEPLGKIYAHCFICEEGVPESQAVDLIHEIDDGVVSSTLTMHAHRECVEKQFSPPHWKDDGTPSNAVMQQFQTLIGLD